MTLANKNNQGSAIDVLMPWRPWLAEPATIGAGEQLSLLKLVDASDVSSGLITIDMQATHILPRVNLDSSRKFSLNLDTANVEYAFEETEVSDE